MKKLIYSIGIVAIAALAAEAAPVKTTRINQALPTQSKELTVLSSINLATFEAVPTDGKSRKVSRKVSASDFEGSFEYMALALVGTDSIAKGTFSITPYADEPGKYVIEGLADWDENTTLLGEFEESTGHFIIPNQEIGFASNYNYSVWFWNYSAANAVDEETGRPIYAITRNNQSPFYFRINENGNLVAGNIDPEKWSNREYTDAELMNDLCMLGLIMPDYPKENAFFMLLQNLTAAPIEPFTFVEDEWQKLGSAHFKDAWLPIFWNGGNTPDYDVEVYYEKNNPASYLIMNPYGVGTPYGDPIKDEETGEEGTINMYPDKPGYIIFNIREFDCVLVEMFVPALTLDMGDPTTSVPTEIYLFNVEGYNYYKLGASYDDIISYYDSRGMELSYFDRKSQTVTFYNPMFSQGKDYLTPYAWTNYPDAAGYIELPDNWEDKVDLVIGEEEGPAVYYNIQGVRVANPEKGQLVIVRKGNKATKQIFR